MLFADLALRPEAQVVVDKHSGKNASSRAVFQKTNVTDWQQLDRMFEVAEREFGELDLVCPGAGVYEPVRLYMRCAKVQGERLTDAWAALEQLLSSPRLAS